MCNGIMIDEPPAPWHTYINTHDPSWSNKPVYYGPVNKKSQWKIHNQIISLQSLNQNDTWIIIHVTNADTIGLSWWIQIGVAGLLLTQTLVCGISVS